MLAKRKFQVAAQVVALLICAMFAGGADSRKAASIAEVNGAPITRQRFQVEYRQAVNDYARKGNPINEAYLRNLRARLIDYLVETELLLQDALARGVSVTDEELRQTMAAERAASTNDEGIDAQLQAAGLSREQYRERRRSALTIEKLIREHIAPDVVIRDQDIAAYYTLNAERFHVPERLHIRHITLRLPPDADETQKKAVRDRIRDIQHQHQNGRDFAELAYRYSEDPSRQKHGDAGFIDAGLAARTFGERVLEIPTGQVGPPLETPLGYHLVAIEARQPQRVIPLEDVRGGIRRILYREQTDAPVKAYVKALRARATIVIHE